MNFNNNRIITKKRFHKIKKTKNQTRKLRLKRKKKSKKNRSFRRRKKSIHLKNKSVKKYKKKYKKKYRKKKKGGGNTPSQETGNFPDDHPTHFTHTDGIHYRKDEHFVHEGKVFSREEFRLDDDGMIISKQQAFKNQLALLFLASLTIISIFHFRSYIQS